MSYINLQNAIIKVSTSKIIMHKLYIIQHSNENLYKVGYTKVNIINRLTNLQVGNPYPLECRYYYKLDSAEQEHKIHMRLAQYLVQGEWFEIDIDNLLKIISKYLDKDPIKFSRIKKRKYINIKKKAGYYIENEPLDNNDDDELLYPLGKEE